MKMFIDEVSNFSKKNWFVYIIFVILLIIARYTDSDNLGRVILVILIHFVADIFIMIMFSAYARREYQTATFFQIISTLLFLTLKIYTGLIDGEWVYLVADIVFILAAIKSYQFNVKQRLIKWINNQTMTVLSLILLVLIFCVERNTETTIISGFQNSMLTIGLFPFAISLSILQNEKLRIKLSTIALICIIIGASGKILSSFFNGGTWSRNIICCTIIGNTC